MEEMDIGKIYKKAFAIIKKNKVLWVFGLALLIFAGGQSGFSNFGNASRGLNNSFTYKSSFKQMPLEVQSFSPVVNYLSNLAISIPVSFWIGLGASVLIALLVSLVITIIVGSWARGAAIGAVNDAFDDKKVSLRSGALHGLRSLSGMIWLTVVPWLLYFLTFVVGLVVLGLITSWFSKSVFVFIPIVLIVLLVLGAIVVSLGISVSQIWAERIVVIEGKKPKEALFEGFLLARKNLLKMLFLGCANCLLGCCLGSLTAGLFAAFIAWGIVLVFIKRQTGFYFLAFIGLILLILVLAITLLTAIFRIFNYTTWNILYRQIRGHK